LLQRAEVLGLARTFEVWLVGRRAPVRRGATLPSLAEEHAAAIRSRFSGPVDLIGESTGGSIALQLALDHPELVGRLVLVSAAARMRRRGREAQAHAADLVRKGRRRRAAAAILATTTERRAQRRVLGIAGFLLGRLAIGRDDRALARMIDAEDGFDVRADLGRVSARTLLIGGGRDGYYSSDLFEQTAARIPDATFLELPGKGHLSAALDAGVRRAIRAFLQPSGPSDGHAG
jgi:pimeloyl-ACP methyl ester carboxylesterase